MRFIVARAFALLGISQARLTQQFVPGATWTASNTGKHIQAHGAGMIKDNGRYYMVGEDRTDGPSFLSVNCYSSHDLSDWEYEGPLLSVQPSGDLGPKRVVERPKVIYNRSTKKYVMYLHIDDDVYAEAKVGVAVSDSVCGKYDYKGSFRPLGRESRDISLYQEVDGTAYLLTEDRTTGLRINRLTDDYLNVSSVTHVFSEGIEAPALAKNNGTYYLFGSGLTWFFPNDNIYATARSLDGPWSSWNTFAAVNTSTYSSQTTYVLPMGDHVLWMGDRWVIHDLKSSTYIWLPLQIKDTNVTMDYHGTWSMDLPTGKPKIPTAENSYEAEESALGGSDTVSCVSCSQKKATYIRPGASATFRLDPGRAATTTLRIMYVNGDAAERQAWVSVNGGRRRLVSFLPTGTWYTPGASVIDVALTRGRNDITIEEAGCGGRGLYVDRFVMSA